MADLDLQVSGGTGGIRAQLDEIERSGRQLGSVAAELNDHGRAVLSVAADPQLRLTASASPVTFARAEAALTGAVLGPAGLAGLGLRLELLGSGALAAVQGYRQAEAVAGMAVRSATTIAGQFIGRNLAIPGLVAVAPGLLTVATVTVVRPHQLRRLGALTLRLLANPVGPLRVIGHLDIVPILPGVIGGMTSALPGGPVLATRVFGHPGGPNSMAEVATGLAGLGGPAGAIAGGPPWFRERLPVRATVAAAPPRPARNTADLLNCIPNGRSRIHVERIMADAGPHWVVAVPGTRNWAPVAGSTPLDLTGDVRLLAGNRTAGTTAVLAALRAIRVPRDEPVLLVGHSQGGMIAAALAADPSVRQEFSVRHVLTSGAPIGGVRIPDEVQVLSIEHTDDLVPQLDGSANHDRPNWVTVRTAALVSDRPEGEAALSPHRADLYRLTAERIDASAEPSLLSWRAEIAPYLSDSGDSGESRDGPAWERTAWDVEISRAGTG